MSKNPEQISCLSIIICDEIYRDEDTKKLVIIGTFNRILASSLPCKHPRFTVLFTITNAKGNYDLRVSVEHERTGNIVLEVGGPLKVENPLDIKDLNLVMRDLIFLEEGKYWVTIKADGAIIQQRPFFVSLVAKTTREDANSRGD